MKHIAIGQAGGPTSVINSTLVGFIEGVIKQHRISFILNGYEGLVKGDILEGNPKNVGEVIKYKDLPGACLGSGRFQMNEADIISSVTLLKTRGIETLVFVGGDGTMKALEMIQQEAIKQSFELQVIGLPKTVDNDIGITDHAPGFGSAAKFVANVTRDLSYDLYSMRNFEQVRIIETMGRNTGWLAAASGYLKTCEKDGPHFIAIPERRLDKEKMLDIVRNTVKKYGYAIIVVSEGVKWSSNNQVGRDTINGRTVLGGISQKLEEFIKENLDVKVRSEVLGMSQRCFSSLISEVDHKEAYLVGKVAAKWIMTEKTGVMASIHRLKAQDYVVEIRAVPLESIVSSGEREMPDTFIDDNQKYYQWLQPIIDIKNFDVPREIESDLMKK